MDTHYFVFNVVKMSVQLRVFKIELFRNTVKAAEDESQGSGVKFCFR